jgi:6,7-dimethyl-8-ribityllumazine synthase
MTNISSFVIRHSSFGKMSTFAPPRSRANGRKRHFAIVASLFNRKYVQGLVDHATGELKSLSPAAAVSLHRVPGAFEIPVVVQELARQKKADAILALGVILQGKTGHAQNLARSVTSALQQIALEQGIPVINAVLSLESEAHARERCLGSKINRGTEAARAAIQIAEVMRGLRTT